MYAYNRVDGTYAWYPGKEDNPSGGGCGGHVLRFTDTLLGITDDAILKALYDITACPKSFDLALLSDLGTPVANGGIAEIGKFSEVSDLIDLHELMHLVSRGGRIRHSNKM